MSFQVSGNAGDARNLKQGILSDACSIRDGTKKLAASSAAVKQVWKDKGNEAVDEIVQDLSKALKNSAEGVEKTCQILEAYAKFLENH